jgi:hypothetical protein
VEALNLGGGGIFIRKAKTPSCTLQVTDFGEWCRVQSVMEVRIYFSFLEFWPGAEIGRFSAPLRGRVYPEDIVVSPKPLSMKFGSLGEAKISLDNPSILN